MRTPSISTLLLQVAGGVMLFLQFRWTRPGVDNLHFRRLSAVDGGSLTKPFSVEEVKAAADILCFISEFHRNGELSKVLNATFIALIPKILDGILIANEAVDEARESKKELLLFKVDFEKAYDSVD
ncbi:cysteine-rich receptor-like protein kinase [Trifolium medium]|uniref:Cysteine-rich receptor-like protein kinase n=1 Tax=Trifolium medium TaxID=97028 RepID=A0A392PAJ9_9FABA|nr:cysteine-rich receptor-like protein kinase [Trifolium medium]